MADRKSLAAMLLNQSPGYTYGTILPMAYNKQTGDHKLAMPGILADLLNSPVKMGQMIRGEREIDPAEVFQASMDFSPAGLLNKAPAGALGMGAVRRGAKTPDLPMDEASRMARADSMFPIDAYHGTNKDFTSFSNQSRGGVTRAKSAHGAHWFSDDAKTTASGYADLAGDNEVQKLLDASRAAEIDGKWDLANKLMGDAEKLDQVVGRGENILPVRLRGNLKKVDMDGAEYDPDDINLSEILKEAKKEGFEGVQFNNFSDEAGYGVYNPTTHYAIFDPKNIRSRFAKFDPAKVDNPDLLAAKPGVPLPQNERQKRQGLAEILAENMRRGMRGGAI